MDGLSEILKQKYGGDDKDEAKQKALIIASEMKAKQIIAKKGRGSKLSLQDLS